MSFDPQKEDYQRFAIRYLRDLDTRGPFDIIHEMSKFSKIYNLRDECLPQCDTDRAAHLVFQATKVLDYEYPFVSEPLMAKTLARGRSLLDEAISLDPNCYDAIRMSQFPYEETGSYLNYLEFLNANAEEVRIFCLDRRDEVLEAEDFERALIEANLVIRPYLRWVADQARVSLICGRNGDVIRFARQALRIDPSDRADVRYSALYALAKLEQIHEFEALVKHFCSPFGARRENDPWTLIGQMALLFKLCAYDDARMCVDALFSCYPHAGPILYEQREILNGTFARILRRPYMEDELIVAVSEAVTLLQEGVKEGERGTLSLWLAQEAERRDPDAALGLEAISRSMAGGFHEEGGVVQ